MLLLALLFLALLARPALLAGLAGLLRGRVAGAPTSAREGAGASGGSVSSGSGSTGAGATGSGVTPGTAALACVGPSASSGVVRSP